MLCEVFRVSRLLPVIVPLNCEKSVRIVLEFKKIDKNLKICIVI